jgi:hypothetical protein
MLTQLTNNTYLLRQQHLTHNTSLTNNNDDDLNFVTKWDAQSDKIFIFIFSILSIPSNILLIAFYAHRICYYKRYNKKFAPKLKHVYAANCFNTYLVEICIFDTIISVYLLTDTIFKQLYDYKITAYESIFDISQFTCKFFIHALHISAAMTGWLTFLLTFNRYMLLFRLRSNRLCINTKYLTLFLFCICTVANVFRLELLYFNSDYLHNQLNSQISNYSDLIVNPGCGFNLASIVYGISETTNTVFWSLILYNIIFSITPACGNLLLSIYLIKRHSDLKNKFLINRITKLNSTASNSTTIVTQATGNIIMLNEQQHQQQQYETNYINLNINKYTADFFHTCIPCITISCTYVICYLPNTILETVNQIIPTLFIYIFQARIYISYLRYLFHGCKFYLLFLVSYKFRKEFLKFLKKNCCCCCFCRRKRDRPTTTTKTATRPIAKRYIKYSKNNLSPIIDRKMTYL